MSLYFFLLFKVCFLARVSFTNAFVPLSRYAIQSIKNNVNRPCEHLTLLQITSDHPLLTKPKNSIAPQLLLSQTDENNEKNVSLEAEMNENYYVDRNYSNMGPLSSFAEKLDDVTGDWALSYADLSPTTPKTPVGVAFLATNACYACAGLVLGMRGDFLLGGLTEIAGAVSFWYHYSQLEFGKDRSEVRLALLVDYFTAGSALITGGVYMSQMGITAVPMEALAVGGLSILCLGLCWVWEFGYPYLFWHSLWHILSALTGYLVGQAHLDNIAIY